MEQGANTSRDNVVAKLLSFRQFAEAAKVTGAVNRLPAIGKSTEVLVYQVYLNGEMAAALPEDLREFKYSDVMLHQVTERSGLDPMAFRDNLKMAEITALRSAWMTSVLNHTSRSLDGVVQPLPEHIIEDYESLARGFTHPWVTEQIADQKLRSLSLKPAMEIAAATIGTKVEERVPDDVNKGRVVAQSSEFTVQDMGEGSVVAHENHRLDTVPQIGEDVTITYYRGHGQVFDNNRNIDLSAVFLDPATRDLAILAKDRQTGKDQMILFDGATSFSNFVKAQQLSPELLTRGLDVLAEKPKLPPKERPQRSPATAVYVDWKSGALAMDYMESEVRFTALFSSIDDLRRLSSDYGISPQTIEAARKLDEQIKTSRDNRGTLLAHSMRQAKSKAGEIFDSVTMANDANGRYSGRIIDETQFHIIQDGGRRTAIIHDKLKLENVPRIGQSFGVHYAGGRGRAVNRTVLKSLERE